jgi:hypothetical protein
LDRRSSFVVDPFGHLLPYPNSLSTHVTSRIVTWKQMSCACYGCHYSRMVHVPAFALSAMETRSNTSPSINDQVVFKNCYRLVRSYLMQNVHGFGGFALARALRSIAVLHNKHPTTFFVQAGMVTLAETALPAAFATGMDATSLCDAWTFVAAMWNKKPSPRLK